MTLYDNEYRKRRQQLMATITPDSVCWRCGQPARQGDPFEAGHIIDGERSSPLALEHKSCNRSHGGYNGARASRQQRHEPASRDWISGGPVS